jgi:hypothetical protein
MTVDQSEQNSWNTSRSGAWAGRGFEYQHLISVLILVRQWACLAPEGMLVPEGLEDSVIELPDRDIWIQIKSRQEGCFGPREVQNVISKVKSNSDKIKNKKKRHIAVCLEQQVTQGETSPIDQLFSNYKEITIVCNSPMDEILSIIQKQTGIADILAEGIASDLYFLISKSSASNASLSFENRRRISTSEIEQRIFERIESEDPSAIDEVFFSRVLEPIDFSKAVSDDSFYQGVKVVAGHVTNGLVIERPKDIHSVVTALNKQRHVLVAGQSGAGKSAILWLVAHHLAGQYRWLQINSNASAKDADSIIRFVRSRRPKSSNPIALAFDEISSLNSDLFNILIRELRGSPDTYILGSVRSEDIALISNQSDTEFVEISLDSNTAQSIWKKLVTINATDWVHWREPFEQSEGLMLEYVHILTQGKRLSSLIKEQVVQREQELRADELAIIRVASVLCSYGAELDAKKLPSLLDLSPIDASKALKRLIDEHLIRESHPGVLGGLHYLRSEALASSSHDEIIYQRSDSLWLGLSAATEESLPRLIHSIVNESDEIPKETLQKLASLLISNSNNVTSCAAILTGLGLGGIDKSVELFIKILEKYEVQSAQWPLASMFCDSSINIPDLTEFDEWRKLKNAVLEFRKVSKRDLRKDILRYVPSDKLDIQCNSLSEANKLLSSCAPILGNESIRLKFTFDIKSKEHKNIEEVASFLSTAYHIAPELAKRYAEEFGGEDELFSLFVSQTPWVTEPTIEVDKEGGRVVRSNWYLVAEDFQTEPHETICEICEILFAISPSSDTAACDVVNPQGLPVSVGDYQPWTKKIPRGNLPEKVRVAWNIAFRQIFLSKTTTDRLTDYSDNMARLVCKTEKTFRVFSEKWIRGKNIANREILAEEVNNLIQEINALTFSIPEIPISSMENVPKAAGESDTLGALLTGVLGNLMPRMGKIFSDNNVKSAAVFSGDLAAQAREHKKSDIWRTISNPPLTKLEALAERLFNISCILHEFAFDASDEAINKAVKSTKKDNIGQAVKSLARRCSFQATQRLDKKLKDVFIILTKRGWSVQLYTRKINERDSVYWPALEVAILINIASFDIDGSYLEDCFSVASEKLGTDYRFRVAPVINDWVIGSMAMIPSSLIPTGLPDTNFEGEWKCSINLPFLRNKLVTVFDAVIASCIEISSIAYCRDLENIHPKEEEALSNIISSLDKNIQLFSRFTEEIGSDELYEISEYLGEIFDRLKSELKSLGDGRPVDSPICMLSYDSLSGNESELVTDIAVTKLLLIQTEALLIDP